MKRDPSQTGYTIDPRQFDGIDSAGSNGFARLVESAGREKSAECEKLAVSAPLMKLVDFMIVEALRLKATDIHVEPEEMITKVRYRVEGILHTHMSIPKDLCAGVLCCIKALSGLDTAQRRLPQEGKFIAKVGDKSISLRVACCPTVNGENAVVSLLEDACAPAGMAGLGMPDRELVLFKKLIRSPFGMIIVTGPAGSGKTTTLYSVLQALNKEDVNIMTAEDPVEYRFEGIRQVQVSPKTGLTFASALRSFLHQDPDIIMAGELRDKESARIAIEAALTGHMVFSALHTGDSASSIAALVGMGIEPFLLSSSLLGVLSQRLVRKVCNKCRQRYMPPVRILKDLKIADETAAGIKFARGKGCAECSGSGYRGRMGIYELLRITPGIQNLMINGSSPRQIIDRAEKEGMITLRQAAVNALFAGQTTAEEVYRVVLDSE